MKNLLILISLITINSWADTVPEKNIVCGFGQCVPDSSFVPSIYTELANQTVIDLGNNNNATIKATLSPNQDPRNLVLMVNNNTTVGQNLILDLKSKKTEKNTGSLTLIGDIFNNINISLDGYDGATGQDASIICADRFKAGAYGENSKTFFINRRTNSPTLSLNRCDNQDIQHLQDTKFTCPNPDFRVSDFDTVQVSRVKFKQRCVGTSIRYKCVQRKIKLRCEWASIARGREYSCGKNCTQRCERVFGASNCEYGSGFSCWRSDLNVAENGAAYYSDARESDAPAWSLSQELGRCSPRKEPGSFGGWFANQRTDELNEMTYLNALNSGSVEALCQAFPNPTKRNDSSKRAWKFHRVAEAVLTTPGLDPDTQNLLPGSNWDLRLSDFFIPCSTYGEFETLNSQIDTWTAFGDVGNSCGDARIPEDTNNLIPWSKAGEVQDPTFGTETVLCSPGNCPVPSLVQSDELSLDKIDPSSGANGTAQGNGNLLIYDTKTITATARPGVAGNGGRNDISNLQQTKYCVKVDDANTQGVLSPFANTPLVNFNIYTWKALDVNRGQPSGGNPAFSNNAVRVFKKLDSSIRFLLQREISLQ